MEQFQGVSISSIKKTNAAYITGILLFLAGCNAGETSGNGKNLATNTIPTPKYWETPTPDFSFDPDRPVIKLVGPKVITINIGENYEDPGATVTDLQDNDISTNLIIDNQINNSEAGDYFIRYHVTDSSKKQAIDGVRIVRVVEGSPVDISPRPVGTTQSHLGYIEHLPDDYGLDPDKKFPLLIFNHGNGANVEFSGDNSLGALSNLLQNAGPPLLLNAGKWDSSLPFIVLSPQIGNISNIDVSARVDAFIDYATNTYKVDESRIYFTGWSQGGFLSFMYAIEHSDRVAAIISVSGGLPVTQDELPANFCNIENVPVWAFHGESDDVVSVKSSIDSIDLIEANCQPTVRPRLSILQGKPHTIHHAIFNLSAIEGGSLEAISDPDFDPYDQSIYEWLLSFDLDDR